MPDAQQKTQLNYVAMSFRCALGLTVVETPVGMDPDIPPGRYSLGHTPQTPPRTISPPFTWCRAFPLPPLPSAVCKIDKKQIS